MGCSNFLMKQKNNTIFQAKLENTTNNRMELLAPIMALKKIKYKSEVVIFTDSTYVKNGITEWIKKWVKNDWISSSTRNQLKNKDLWVDIK